MKFLLALILTGTAAVASAQTLPSKDVDTVRSGIGEEDLAPIPVKKTLPVVSSSTTPPAAGAAAVSGSEAAVNDPFVVKNVVVTLSGTTGFDRDAALEQGARQALPGVLVGMGMDSAAAAKTVKGLGSPMNFVKSFKVVKETLIPNYVLTSDLTFNGAMLQKNFGGKIPAAKPVAAVIGETPVEGEVPAAQNVAVKQWVVRVSEHDPAAVDKVRVNLNRQPNTRATYRLLTSAGAELVVDTPLTAADVTRFAGRDVSVVELEIPLPAGVIQTGGGDARAWQGQEEPSAPRSPSAPSEPSAPADPNAGSY